MDKEKPKKGPNDSLEAAIEKIDPVSDPTKPLVIGMADLRNLSSEVPECPCSQIPEEEYLRCPQCNGDYSVEKNICNKCGYKSGVDSG